MTDVMAFLPDSTPIDLGSAPIDGPNWPLIQAVYDYIKAHPEQWVQSEWSTFAPKINVCNTAFCFAGWSCMFTGSVLWDKDNDGLRWAYAAATDDGEEADWHERAIELLNITNEEAENLFAGHNEFADIQKALVEIADDNHYTGLKL